MQIRPKEQQLCAIKCICATSSALCCSYHFIEPLGSCNIPRLKAVQMMIHWPLYPYYYCYYYQNHYIYPSWIDTLVCRRDRCTEVAAAVARTLHVVLLRCVCACMVDIMHVHESMQLIVHGVELMDIGSTGHYEA
jgi:hypothetical protein